ncbi:hypothetical protein [Chromobacterium sp. IIBBL 290-4]|uniref:hypothetical protein n=1 Tax=Chromobacterium sp. IIBBL 290-4 TaxID=2953890 RepID=UPI0020B6A897|nr:hypothetical protein [Chromobacterium sp. IIBBL 290-4]UTH76599.1 hypothetical protein NKT35_11075 [Chromobacterium sp. IIBBL 290-4]
MKNYNDEYYFITFKESDQRPILGPDEDTDALRFETQDVTSGFRRPLFFINSAALVYEKAKFHHTPSDILFCGSDVIIESKIYEKLVETAIPNLILQPCVYVDEKEIWHENYWYMTFTEKFDCWDRAKSRYDPDPIELNGKNFYSITHYQLDEDFLQKIELKNRLLFRMDADLSGHIVVHKSIAPFFRTNNIKDAELVPIKDYGVNFFH